MKKETLTMFGMFVLGLFLAYYLVPAAIIIFLHTTASFYKTQFYWNVVVFLIYSGYIADKVTNEKQTEAAPNEFKNNSDSTSN